MTTADPLQKLAPDALTTARVMALGWTFRTRTQTYDLLRHLGAKTAAGRGFTHEDVKTAQRALAQAGLLHENATRVGYVRLTDAARVPLYRALLTEVPVDRLRSALVAAGPGYHRGDLDYWPTWDPGAMVARLRLELLSGLSEAGWLKLRGRFGDRSDLDYAMSEALLDGFDPVLFERVAPRLRWELTYDAVARFNFHWREDMLPVVRWALARIQGDPAAAPPPMREIVAETMLYRGETQAAAALLVGDASGFAEAVRAGSLAVEGRWAPAQTAFESALKKLQGEQRARKRLLPASIAWLYPLALIAQATPRHLEAAKKFCTGEAGSRDPRPDDGWGLWAHAISVRLGDAALAAHAFTDPNWSEVSWVTLWRALLRAWLGPSVLTEKARGRFDRQTEAAVVDALRKRLAACELGWLDAQVHAAERVLAGGESPPGFFAHGRGEDWRNVLVALAALGSDTLAEEAPAKTRILWSVELARSGAVEAVVPLEQKQNARGWSRPRPLPLSRVATSTALEPWDAKVARAIRKDPHATRAYRIDRAVAMVALIGHPGVVLATAPERTVEVVEGTAQLEVVPAGEGYELKVTPAIRPESDEGNRWPMDEHQRREHEALRYLTVLRDSPQRIRVVVLSPAQRRAAQLVADRFSVPAEAKSELDSTLRALAGHFQIHADDVRAAREIAAEPRLRAELAPAGDGLSLRLVVAPLGVDGPRLRPGSGRARVMAAIGGESVGADRDLAAERSHLEEVVTAFDFLDPIDHPEDACEWVVDAPERALALVERLPQLAGVEAVDWPRGSPVRVITVGAPQLAVRVKSERDWLSLAGRVTLDEGRVLELEALLAATGTRSRFVPMGDGVYAALTRDLRDKLAEIAAVADVGKDAVRVPQVGAAWLDDVLEGTEAQRDPAFTRKIERLRAAQSAAHPLPGGLQATLRPYQEDGFAWAMRLAQAGFGACLADDMGLGKTIQALAVLLARAAGGPALVIAPTSVCGNWLAETRRFAPSLNPILYGEGDRAAALEAAGAGDVVIVSYTLMQQAQEAFAGRTWHTLIADEAQAVKNAAAKRSLALFDLNADFRMALSGTPIENRLAELWSIMRHCNPGLLGGLSRFNERFAGPIERERDREAQRVLRRLIAPFVLRRTKAQVLEDLPPRTELVLTIEPPPDEAALYEALRRQAVAEAEAVADGGAPGQARFNILAQLTRLRRAACDPRLTAPALALTGAKVRAFAELAAELSANRHKALVFSQFVDFLTLLRAPLDEAGIAYQYLDGATPPAERTRRVAAFQAGEGDLFLISLKAGGFGLNLTAADYVVITDPWWNPAAEDQAMGRAHRIGQQRPVTVYRLVTKGTLEERIVELHHDKRALAEGVLAEDGEAAQLPSTEELIALMRGA